MIDKTCQHAFGKSTEASWRWCRLCGLPEAVLLLETAQAECAALRKERDERTEERDDWRYRAHLYGEHRDEYKAQAEAAEADVLRLQAQVAAIQQGSAAQLASGEQDRKALVDHTWVLLNELGLGRGTTLASVQRRLRVGTGDAMRLFALREAAMAALSLSATPTPGGATPNTGEAKSQAAVANGGNSVLPDLSAPGGAPSPAPSILGIPVRTHADAPRDQIALVKDERQSPAPCGIPPESPLCRCGHKQSDHYAGSHQCICMFCKQFEPAPSAAEEPQP